MSCSACDLVSSNSPLLVAARDGFTVHGLNGPTPIPAWAVVTSNRHVRGVYDLSDDEWRSLGPLINAVMNAQRRALSAEHVYLFAIGDVLHHAHLHLIPRYPDTPERLKGRGAFDTRPGDHIADAAALQALSALRASL